MEVGVGMAREVGVGARMGEGDKTAKWNHGLSEVGTGLI